jgi:hypothetical protein
MEVEGDEKEEEEEKDNKDGSDVETNSSKNDLMELDIISFDGDAIDFREDHRNQIYGYDDTNDEDHHFNEIKRHNTLGEINNCSALEIDPCCLNPFEWSFTHDIDKQFQRENNSEWIRNDNSIGLQNSSNCDGQRQNIEDPKSL